MHTKKDITLKALWDKSALRETFFKPGSNMLSYYINDENYTFLAYYIY